MEYEAHDTRRPPDKPHRDEARGTCTVGDTRVELCSPIDEPQSSQTYLDACGAPAYCCIYSTAGTKSGRPNFALPNSRMIGSASLCIHSTNCIPPSRPPFTRITE